MQEKATKGNAKKGSAGIGREMIRLSGKRKAYLQEEGQGNRKKKRTRCRKPVTDPKKKRTW